MDKKKISVFFSNAFQFGRRDKMSDTSKSFILMNIVFSHEISFHSRYDQIHGTYGYLA